ncbi:MAG: helix-turn-helix domain-containing protein [Clostridia bacterium]|nr:helix-turn-helix domain-containing protein [Clostridia bacterium]
MQRLRELRKKQGISLRTVADALGISESALSLYESGRRRASHKLLCRLADYYHVTVDYLLERDILMPPRRMLPIYGVIRAGGPDLAREEIEGWHVADVDEQDDCFYLRVQGDSMEGAGIHDGSLVLLRRQSFANNGQIVACLVGGECATLKRFRRDGRVVALLPENSKYQPILLTTDDFDNGTARILGVAIEVTRKLI